VAFSFSRTGASNKIAISADGSSVVSDIPAEDFTVAAIYIGSIAGFSAFGSICSITVYELQDDAALPALSTI